MFTHPKSTMRVLCMVMRSSSGHVTLLREQFQPPKFSPNRTYGAKRPHVGLCPKFLVEIFLLSLAQVLKFCI